jgi:exodeoxyribonuclease-5
MVQFSDDQKKLVSEIGKFTRDPNKTEFVVHGLAGTGKTTVATRLAQYFSNSILCAFTNRAANILSEKSGLTAHTIHRVLYGIPTKVIDEKGRVQLKFSDKKQPPGSLKGMIIFVDECSMLNETIVNDLRDTGAKLIFLGDHGQLPPVQGKSAITKADFTLTEIHRQAAESPIIQQAYNVRTRRDYYAVGDEFRVTRSLDHGSLLQSDIVLCWKNATRARMNQECRTARGISGYPKKGEPAMLYSNRTHAGLFKGQVFTLAEDIKAEGDDIWLYAEGQESGDIWRVKNGWFS